MVKKGVYPYQGEADANKGNTSVQTGSDGTKTKVIETGLESKQGDIVGPPVKKGY